MSAAAFAPVGSAFWTLRLGRLVWRLVPSLAFAVFGLGTAVLLGASPTLRRQAVVSAGLLLVFAAARALVMEVLSPERPALRLLPLGDAKARTLAAGLRLALVLLFLFGTGLWLVVENAWRPSIGVLLRVGLSVVVAVTVAGLVASTGLFRWLRSRPDHTFLGLLARFTGRIVVPLLIFAVLFLVVVSGLGYVPLARYVAGNLVTTGVQLVAAVLGYHYLRQGLRNALRYLHGGEVGPPGGAPSELDPGALTLIGVERISEAALRLVVVVAMMVWVFAGWQLGLGELLGVLAAPAFGLSGAPTWGQVLGAIFKVVAVLVFGWLLRQVLTFFVFPRSRMEIGARYAILAMMHYLVIALAFVFALEGLGLDTSSLGWFFGAAGVGIGLGLQDVIGNFFSGLIMLVERPIRVGDTVQVADVVGKVQDIRMRGTVIRTFDNTTVLIPNRQMLGERVTNLSYGLGHARVTVQVGVDGDADPRRVQELLLDVARGHPDLLADPAPLVWFTNFAASSIDFTLVGFTANVADRIGVASDLRQAVFGRLRQEGIGVPLPRMDVHLA